MRNSDAEDTISMTELVQVFLDDFFAFFLNFCSCLADHIVGTTFSSVAALVMYNLIGSIPRLKTKQ